MLFRSVRERLWREREKRVHPGRDDKIVAAWNGMAIAALAEAGQLFDEPTWVEAATAAADLLIVVHLGAAGNDRLCWTSRAGKPGSNLGVLSDYAGVAEGLVVLHQVTGELRRHTAELKEIRAANRVRQEKWTSDYQTGARRLLGKRPKGCKVAVARRR